jgi:hypothetical protein
MAQQLRTKPNTVHRNGASPSSPNGRSPKAIAASTRAACPVCHSRDRMEKVSNIVRNGRGRLVWDDGEVSHYESELAELLDEPAPPKQKPVFKLFLSFIPPLLILAAIVGVIELLEVQTFFDVPAKSTNIARNIGLAWFGLLIPGVLIVQFVQSRLDHRRETPRWLHARRRWTGLYYCSRDDIVFTPSFNMVASPPEMHTLLYPPEPLTDERVKQLAQGGLWEATTTE